MSKTVGEGGAVFVPNFLVFNVTQAEESLYTTTSNATVDGELYAASVDFSPESFAALCGLLGDLGAWLLEAFSTPFDGPRRADFPEPVAFDLHTVLGAPVTIESETFVPLLASGIDLS